MNGKDSRRRSTARCERLKDTCDEREEVTAGKGKGRRGCEA